MLFLYSMRIWQQSVLAAAYLICRMRLHMVLLKAVLYSFNTMSIHSTAAKISGLIASSGATVSLICST